MATYQVRFSPKVLQRFVKILSADIGEKNLPVVLEKSGLPKKWADSENVINLNEESAAKAYAGIQQAVRAYYGRGARGILQRTGNQLWKDLLDNAPLKEKAQAKLLRGLPETPRRKSTLDMLVRLLDARYAEMSVHTLDQNLMLVDKISPTTYDQHNEEAICHVTRGLIHEAIYWATDQDPQIEESECKASGGSACEFRIKFGD